jgi:ubiquinone biosynthesis protein
MLHLGAIERLERDTRRVAEIVGVLAKYGLADWLKSIPLAAVRERLRSVEGQPINELATNERFRLALTELGTTFIKLGQMLSTRPDVIGIDLAEELSRLQSDTQPDEAATVRALLTEELGRPPEEVFGFFAEEAFASASIAQVHLARLPTGENVVVKIQKADIQTQVESDLSILAGLAELAEKHVEQLRPYEPVALVRQFRRMILRELDFHTERRNLEEFARNFADDPGIRFPKPWPEFSSRRVLTMERFEGVLGADPDGLKATGVDLGEFARRGANMYLEMIFRDSFYHADPHPGNLMLLPGGVIGVLDCGMAGRLDESLRDEVEALLLAVAQRDAEALTDAVFLIGAVPANASRDQLRADLADFVAEYTRQSVNELDLTGALRSLADIIRRHHISLPPGVSLLLRTLVVLDGTAQLLNPGFSLAEVIQPFYTRAIGRRLSPQRLWLRLQRSYRDWDRLLQALPRDLTETLQRLRSGRLTVHLDHRHLDPVVNRLVLGILSASLFLGSSLLWSMKAPPLLFGVSVFGAAGYLMSVYLGWKLLRAVKHSGSVESRDD